MRTKIRPTNNHSKITHMRMIPNRCKLIWLILFSTGLEAAAQPTISGPACVIPGTSYQYLISGKWDSASTMQICANGAVILGSTNSCTANGAPVAAVSVVWNTGIGSGSLSLSSTSGNSTLSVSISSPLQAGAIDTVSGLQTVGFNLAPADIHCGPDSGGACKPVYIHQWQWSWDNVHWADIGGATGQNLTGLAVQKLTIYYRRRTIETVSSDIGYSNLAVVFVGPPPPGTILPAIN
jgi:hypothetical protein